MTTPQQRSLTYVRLEDLRPAERNPKQHDYGALIQSLMTYGWTNPILVDERTGRMVAGHGRMAAAVEMRAAGATAPRGVLVDDDGEWAVPVLRGWSSVDDIEAQAYIIADNRLTEAGDWHQQTLGAMLEDIVAADAALLDTMAYTADDIDDLLRRTDVTVLPDAVDPNDGEQTIDVPAPIGEENPDRPLDGDTDEGTSADLPLTTCPACAHSWVRPEDELQVLGSSEPTRLGDILRHGSGLLLGSD